MVAICIKVSKPLKRYWYTFPSFFWLFAYPSTLAHKNPPAKEWWCREYGEHGLLTSLSVIFRYFDLFVCFVYLPIHHYPADTSWFPSRNAIEYCIEVIHNEKGSLTDIDFMNFLGAYSLLFVSFCACSLMCMLLHGPLQTRVRIDLSPGKTIYSDSNAVILHRVLKMRCNNVFEIFWSRNFVLGTEFCAGENGPFSENDISLWLWLWLNECRYIDLVIYCGKFWLLRKKKTTISCT